MLFILYYIGRVLALNAPIRVAYGIATFVSSVYCLFSRNDKGAVRDNLKVLFPSYDDKKIDAMTREVFISFGKYLVDFFRFPKVDRAYVDKYVKIKGLENLNNALKEKKGAIILTAHLGSWELGCAIMGILGKPLSAVALDHKNERINKFFIEQRQMKDVEVIQIGAALRKCFSALKNNRALALVGDRDYFDNGIKVNFFGKPTIIPKGPAVFSRRCESPIIPTFVIRNSDDTFTFSLGKPIEVETSEDERQDLLRTTKKIVTILEDTIRQHPTQWHVFRRFWEEIGWARSS